MPEAKLAACSGSSIDFNHTHTASYNSWYYLIDTAKLIPKNFVMYKVKQTSSLRQFIEKDCTEKFMKDNIYYEPISSSLFRRIILVLIDKVPLQEVCMNVAKFSLSFITQEQKQFIFGAKASVWLIALYFIKPIHAIISYMIKLNTPSVKVFVQNSSTGHRTLDKGTFCLVYRVSYTILFQHCAIIMLVYQCQNRYSANLCMHAGSTRVSCSSRIYYTECHRK